MCHKCEPACPVDIDFGDVSIVMRNYLRRSGKRRFNPGTRAAMLFLNLTDPRAVEIDDVEIFEPLLRKGSRLRGGVEVEHGRACHVALFEAHALAVLQVDGGKEDHGFHFLSDFQKIVRGTQVLRP